MEHSMKFSKNMARGAGDTRAVGANIGGHR
jgi:hypothetical protein